MKRLILVQQQHLKHYEEKSSDEKQLVIKPFVNALTESYFGVYKSKSDVIDMAQDLHRLVGYKRDSPKV
jgi:hypothetical protein